MLTPRSCEHALQQGQGESRQQVVVNQLILKEIILYHLGGPNPRGTSCDMVMHCEKDWTHPHWL